MLVPREAGCVPLDHCSFLGRTECSKKPSLKGFHPPPQDFHTKILILILIGSTMPDDVSLLCTDPQKSRTAGLARPSYGIFSRSYSGHYIIPSLVASTSSSYPSCRDSLTVLGGKIFFRADRPLYKGKTTQGRHMFFPSVYLPISHAGSPR